MSKKLYAVVGVMATLIAIELFTLLFAMNMLSALRSFVGGEGLWSKGQKDAVHALHRYAFTHDARFYEQFHRHLQINMGDRAARLELEKPEPDFAKVDEGFVRGGNHIDDVADIVTLIRQFSWVDPVRRALIEWRKADQMIDELIVAAERLDQAIRDPRSSMDRIDRELIAIDHLNERFTATENEFSRILGEGSRWLENLLFLVLLFAVLTVESTGLALTIMLGRNLNRSLSELTRTAEKIGQGDFRSRVHVRSNDELGQLARSINKMSEDLQISEDQRGRAESASQFKSQFLANMSHEIRSPIGVITGLAELLKDPHLSWDDQQRLVETIERTGHDLTAIVNDILDLSKVEAGHLEINPSTFVLADFVTELESMLKVPAGKNRNRLTFQCQGSLPERVHSDRARLRQILLNLVSNALKYTRDGEVTVTYGCESGQLYFNVADTGEGISPADRDKVFQAFHRTEEASRFEGTGLGLMLAQQLARALGGDVILVHSERGQGSVFRATIDPGEVQLAPAGATASADAPVKPAAGLTGRRILVVEDSEDNQLLVKLFLAREGMRVDFAENGEQGRDLALQNDYDAVLMDMQMPVMDGYRATEELRQRGFAKPIIALTAHAMKGDRERCLQAGCSEYLTKPVDSKLLTETIARQIEI